MYCIKKVRPRYNPLIISRKKYVMFCIEYTWTMLEELIEDIVKFHEVGRTLLGGLHKEILLL